MSLSPGVSEEGAGSQAPRQMRNFDRRARNAKFTAATTTTATARETRGDSTICEDPDGRMHPEMKQGEIRCASTYSALQPLLRWVGVPP